MARLHAIREAIDFGHDPDHFGPEFEAFTPKPKRLLPKSATHVKTDDTEDTDRQLRAQIRAGVTLADMEITHITIIPVQHSHKVKPDRRKQALRRAHATPDRLRKLVPQPEMAGQEYISIKIGVSAAELVGHYERERQRYRELSAHATVLRGGKRKVLQRAQAYAILKSLANGMKHPEAAQLAKAALGQLVAVADARQLAHIVKVTDRVPMPLGEQIDFIRGAPRAAFLNVHIQKPLLDRMLRDPDTGTPLFRADMLRRLPELAELAMAQHVLDTHDKDCITPGDIRGYVESLGWHAGRPSQQMYLGWIKVCMRDLKRVPRTLGLRKAAKSHLETAFMDSTRLLAMPVFKPAAASLATPAQPVARHRKGPLLRNLKQ